VGNIFSAVAGGLQASQEYVFRIYATNDFGYDWSDTNVFTTGTAAPGGGAGVIHVDADAVGVEEGLSWTNAFTTFEAALAAADAGLGTNIWVADGSYQAMSVYVVQTNGLSIYGGFAGTETSLGQRDWTNNLVLLDGGATHFVLDIQAGDVLLDGLIITNAFATSVGGTLYGGALTMSSGAQNLTMLNCRVVGNRLDQNSTQNAYGVGAYFLNAGTILISNCVFQANRSDNRCFGVGFYSQNTTMTVLDSEIRDNYELQSDQRGGKGFCWDSGTLTMVRTIVADNYTYSTDGNSGWGTGGYINNGTVSFTNCIFTGNESPNNTSCLGGALYVNNGNVTIENCTFAGNIVHTNSATALGGAIYQNAGTVNIKNSIFWGNEAGTGSSGHTIYQTSGDIMNISYSCLEGTNAPHLVAAGTLNWGSGVITNDPLFAVEYSDVHLKSKGGRWNGSSWVTDAVYSPCIDAGDPASACGNELPGANDPRINLGAYGNTAEASLSWKAGGTLFVFQ